jgi:hypothetical protein
MSAAARSPASPPPAWATLTDELLVEVLRQLARHDRFPMPGAALVNSNVDVSPPLVAVLKRNRAQG